MKNKGFYIKSLVATGPNVVDARIDFAKGCNLIFGKSDTGKSHILHLIEYLLGKKELATVVEGQEYDCYYLEIAEYSTDNVFTIQRRLKENKSIVKAVSYKLFHNENTRGEEYSISYSKNKTTLSSFLLRLSGFNPETILKKSIYDRTVLSYTHIRHLILANENRVVSENPIFNPSNQHIDKTLEKSIIYFLTSGEDDANFNPPEKPEIKKARIQGKMEIIDDVIKSKENQIVEIGDADYADFSDPSFLKEYQKTFDKTAKELDNLNEQRLNLESKISGLRSKQIFVESFLNRLKLLHEHYELDIDRYDFIYQGHQVIELIGDTTICPLCKSHIDAQNIEDGFAEALKVEFSNLIQRRDESASMIRCKEQELENILVTVRTLSSELSSIVEKIRNIEFKIDGIRETLMRYQHNIENKTRLNDLQEETQYLRNEYNKLKNDLKDAGQKQESYDKESNIKDEFCNLLKQKLQEWELDDSQTVVFDESKFDFILGGKDRLSCGKGARGVTCTAILMTLVEFCIKHDIPFTRTLVIDSPITAHFSDEKLPAEETTQYKFFQYINDKVTDYQLIVIDNKSPKQEDRTNLSNINYIEFSSDGRRGFYPINPNDVEPNE
ncbi:AAA family ATPase [uncultured Duncaniella sp.]|uniref:AAA family ATPase n=1 Tax=uncultured Duncaniella sp. TaxID=2768039 RepID=UPI0025A9CC48|nr:AAA family ATPase [uncultured Duncaniella sp.]